MRQRGGLVWPLIGRGEVVGELLDELGRGQGVAMVGAAGVGKSRVLAAVADRLESAEVEVIEITGAQSSAAIPLAPLLHLVDFETTGSLGNLVLAELNRRSKSNRLAILVDDAQNLDEASAAVINRISVAGLAGVLLAIRTGERVPEPLTVLWKDQHLGRVEIEPLNRRDTDRLTEAALGSVTSRTMSQLWDRSQGHPLYLRELILNAQRKEALDSTSGDLQLPEESPVPARLVEIIDMRLDRLDQGGVRGLVSLKLTEPLANGPGEQLIGKRTLRNLVASGLAEQHDDAFHLAHPLYGEVAALRLSNSEEEELTAHAATQLSTMVGREPDVALLLLELDRPIELDLLQRATVEALRLRQRPLASRLAAALANADPSASSFAKLGAAQALENAWDEADRNYRRAIDLAQTEVEAKTVWLGWISETFEYRGDVALVDALATEATAVLPGDGAREAEAWQLKARMFSEPLQPVLERLEQLTLAHNFDVDSERMLELDLASCYWHTCQPHKGLAVLDRGNALSVGDRLYRSRARQVKNALAVWTEGFASAEEQLDEFVRDALETNDPNVAIHAQAAAILLNARAGRAMATARQDPTLDSLTRGATVTRWVSLFLAELAWAQCHLVGHHEQARQSISLAEQGQETVSGPLIELVRSRLASTTEEATEHLAKALALAVVYDLAVYELLILREAVHQLGATQPAIDRINELANRAGPGLADVYRAEAEAVVADDPVALSSAAVAAELYGADGLAWELHALAQIGHREKGALAKALRSELAHERLGQQLPGQYAPVLARLEPVLTERERQVAAGLATGLTNRQIAEDLYLSPSTVKRHLERIYKRLNIDNRQALAQLYESHSDPRT